MRRFSVRDGKIYLNNEPYYLKMALDQGYYPGGLYTTPRDEDPRRDVEVAKLLGLNGVRKHQLAPDPRYLYWCDKLDLLVWGEMADWGMSLKNKDAFLDEWKDVINRDFNYPRIITWVPFNERHSAYENEEEQRALVEIYRKTRELDPSRLVVDNSGYFHTETDIVVCGFCYTQLYDVEGEGEVDGFLTYDRKWKVPPEKIAKIHATLP